MPRTISPLLPPTLELLRQLGERLRLARRRRRLPARQVAARAGMAPMTLRSVERGGAGVTIGAYTAVMQVLGVEQDLDLVAAADSTGRALQDARSSPPRRTARPMLPTPTSSTPETPDIPTHDAAQASPRPTTLRRGVRAAGSSGATGKARTTEHAERGFASARALAAVIDAPRTPRPGSSRR